MASSNPRPRPPGGSQRFRYTTPAQLKQQFINPADLMMGPGPQTFPSATSWYNASPAQHQSQSPLAQNLSAQEPQMGYHQNQLPIQPNQYYSQQNMDYKQQPLYNFGRYPDVPMPIQTFNQQQQHLDPQHRMGFNMQNIQNLQNLQNMQMPIMPTNNPMPSNNISTQYYTPNIPAQGISAQKVPDLSSRAQNISSLIIQTQGTITQRNRLQSGRGRSMSTQNMPVQNMPAQRMGVQNRQAQTKPIQNNAFQTITTQRFQEQQVPTQHHEAERNPRPQVPATTFLNATVIADQARLPKPVLARQRPSNQINNISAQSSASRPLARFRPGPNVRKYYETGRPFTLPYVESNERAQTHISANQQNVEGAWYEQAGSNHNSHLGILATLPITPPTPRPQSSHPPQQNESVRTGLLPTPPTANGTVPAPIIILDDNESGNLDTAGATTSEYSKPTDTSNVPTAPPKTTPGQPRKRKKPDYEKQFIVAELKSAQQPRQRTPTKTVPMNPILQGRLQQEFSNKYAWMSQRPEPEADIIDTPTRLVKKRKITKKQHNEAMLAVRQVEEELAKANAESTAQDEHDTELDGHFEIDTEMEAPQVPESSDHNQTNIDDDGWDLEDLSFLEAEVERMNDESDDEEETTRTVDTIMLDTSNSKQTDVQDDTWDREDSYRLDVEIDVLFEDGCGDTEEITGADNTISNQADVEDDGWKKEDSAFLEAEMENAFDDEAEDKEEIGGTDNAINLDTLAGDSEMELVGEEENREGVEIQEEYEEQGEFEYLFEQYCAGYDSSDDHSVEE